MERAQIVVCHSQPQDALVEGLSDDGHRVVALSCDDVARDRISAVRPDLVLLQLAIRGPHRGGWGLLEWLGEHAGAPGVIVLTSLARLGDRVHALDLGADDVIHEPFEQDEVRARVRSVLRRMRPELGRTRLAIDDERKEVRVGDRCVILSPKEYALLSLLASAPGRVFSSQEIIGSLWAEPSSATGRPSYATDQDAQKYVYLLRRKIETDASKPEIVLTVRGFGYRLVL
jgi:two-component system KDP operon response regulator KdpE